MLSPKAFAAEHYDFFRFAMLTVDLLLTPNKLHIPYDMMLDVIYQHYLLVPSFDENLHESPYDQHESYIRNTTAYFEALQQISE